MSTRALIHIYEDEKDETPLTTIYKHFDGYPTKHGVGEILTDYVMDSYITEGIPADVNTTMDIKHNGMGCFAAGLIKHLKEGIGDVYIVKPGAEDMWEEYVYTIAPSKSIKSKLSLVVENKYEERSSGLPAKETLVAG
tara:strand:+ start:139 stop:552 length:414 start_codon:yes stop_codon:yes gene_type:complete